MTGAPLPLPQGDISLFLLEEFDLALMLFGGFTRVECVEFSTLSRFGILLQRVLAILARFEFSKH